MPPPNDATEPMIIMSKLNPDCMTATVGLRENKLFAKPKISIVYMSFFRTIDAMSKKINPLTNRNRPIKETVIPKSLI